MSRSARRSEQLALAAELRDQRVQYSDIGQALRARYGINARIAQRIARGWTQEDTAAAWSTRWPDDPKSFKNISYWESWPGPTGHAPSLAVLARLAELYECDVADLVAGWGEHSSTRDASGAEGQVFAWQVEHLALPELTRSMDDWSTQLPPDDRRALLLKLSTAAAAAAGAIQPAGDAVPQGSRKSIDELAGPWTSRYNYVSSGRGQELIGEHHVDLTVANGRLVGKSKPPSIGDLDLDLGVNGLLITGSWTERTSGEGYYAGAVYHGLLQMVVDPTGRTMRGRWLGPDKEFIVDSGAWTMTRGFEPLIASPE